jgi:hypothetical protein
MQNVNDVGQKQSATLLQQAGRQLSNVSHEAEAFHLA